MIIKKCKECDKINISHFGVTLDKGCSVIRHNNHVINLTGRPLVLFEQMLLRIENVVLIPEFLDYLWRTEEEENIEYSTPKQAYRAIHDVRKKIKYHNLPFILVNNRGLGYQLNPSYKRENTWLTKMRA